MADNSPTTSFDLIEAHKENIQPIAPGRSARALAASLSPLTLNPHAARSEHYARQAEFEDELKTAREEDDPLDVWLRHINWTMETFPSGHSADSQLLPLLERVTREFAHDSLYKNDARYLKLWIQYAQDYSDAPGEVFAFLAKRQIGQKLALYYEEYAALLESTGRRRQSEEIYCLGMENEARPAERLARKFHEFRERMEANPPGDDEPSSPALPPVRTALATKSSAPGTGGGETRPPSQPTQSSSKPVKQKMAIFSDASSPSASTSGPGISDPAGWESIGSLQHRKKENTQQPKPWVGETLKQKGGIKTDGEKLMVFRDERSFFNSQNAAINENLRTHKRPERIAVNLELLYPGDGEEEEFSFEELRAIKRGMYGIDWNAEREDADHRRRSVNESPSNLDGRSRTPIKVTTVLSPSPNKGKIRRKGRGSTEPTMTFHTKAATDEIYGIFNQPLVQAGAQSNDDSEQSDSPSDSDDDYTVNSQADQAAHSDSGHAHSENGHGDEGDSVHSDWSDFTLRRPEEPAADDRDAPEGVTSIRARMQKLNILSDDLQPSQHRTKIQIPSPPDDFDPPTLPYHVAKDHHQNRLPYMTPIVERTESLPPTTLRRAAKTPSRTKATKSSVIDSSFQEADEHTANNPLDFFPSPLRLQLVGAKTSSKQRPLPPEPPSGPLIQDVLCNPQDFSLRSTVYQKLNPPLKLYDGFYEHAGKRSGKKSIIQKFCKAMSRKDGDRTLTAIPEPPALEFVTGAGGCFYSVKRELGKGAFAPVYLVENIIVGDAEDEAEELETEVSPEGALAGRARQEALKMEDPPSPWEFYVIRQSIARLNGNRAVESIVKAHEMHMFSDEGFLILEYRNQGTILDLVNIAKTDTGNGSGSVMDECLVMFIAVELFRTVEGLHVSGIIHGDLKPDNCLTRFDPIPDNQWASKYQRDGSYGWSENGILLIDFGRGIDLRLFPPSVQFIADWKTDGQDCAEMREMRPWTYQVDYYGLAAILHSMLFGKYIDTVTEKVATIGGKTKYRISSPLKRYWQQDIWGEVFDMLLNPLQHGELPITEKLSKCRERMELWLEGNSEKGVGLKNLVRRMDGLLSSRRK